MLSRFKEISPIMTECDHEILKVLPEEFLLIFTNTHENINDNQRELSHF